MHEHRVGSGNYSVTKRELVELHSSHDATQALQDYGGIEVLASNLGTDLKKGLPDFEAQSHFRARKESFGDNAFPEPKMPSFFSLLVEALKDEMLIILIIAAVVSLILGLAFPEAEDPTTADRIEGSIEGVAILAAVALVSIVQAANNYVQEKQFQKLNKVKQNIPVKVIRGGKNVSVSIHDVYAGDVVELDTGNQVPADGYYISGHNCSVNESNMTGEPEPSRKKETNLKMLSGTYVVTGNCTMLVTATGLASQWGQALKELDEGSERRETPLQEKLGKLARYIGFVGMGVASIVFVVMVIWWLVEHFVNDIDFTTNDINVVLSYFIIAVTIVVVAVPEGLPLAVTMALAYSLMKMRKDMCLVRYLPACETMGGATQICSDKTGTLTQNRMTVTRGLIVGKRFQDPVIHDLNPSVHHLLTEGIALNSTGHLQPPTQPGGFPIYIGQPTECALLAWINKLDVDYQVIREEGPQVLEQFSFSSARKRMSVVIQLPDGKYRMYTKGASEIIMDRCTSKLEPDNSTSPLQDNEKRQYMQLIDEMAGEGLRTLSIAYRDFDVFDIGAYSEDADHEPPEMKLTLIAIVGIEDPVRVEVPHAVRVCQGAGITVRMVTGDNKLTASSIARQCGILTEGGATVEGPEFAKMTDEEVDNILPRLQVLARSSPSDKIRLVKRLIANQELVSVTGDGTNDAPALRGAHIGLAMGGGTEVAKDASDIIILDDNFSSIVKAVMWGRSVFDNIRKFLQFQLTVNVSAMAIAALSAFLEMTPLTAVQLLWVNLIMDSLGALALATEPPTEALLKRPPKNISHPNYSLISPEMWKMILGQALYQIIVLYGGLSFFQYYLKEQGYIDYSQEQIYTLVFNSFIFCQLFNLIACRKINKGEFNVFEGFFKNWAFHLVLVVELITQVFLVGFWIESKGTGSDGHPVRIMEFLDWIGLVFDTVPLNWYQWLGCIGVGLVGFIWNFILKAIPTPEEKQYKGTIELNKEEHLNFHANQDEHSSLLSGTLKKKHYTEESIVN